MSEKSEYPKFMYHKTEAPVIVNNPAEEDALDAGWSDKYQGPETAPAVEEPPDAELPAKSVEEFIPKKGKK